MGFSVENSVDWLRLLFSKYYLLSGACEDYLIDST